MSITTIKNDNKLEDDIFLIISNAYETGYHSGYPELKDIKKDVKKIFILFKKYKNKSANKSIQRKFA